MPLQPQEEARLIAAAQAKGLFRDALAREALDKILAEAPKSSPQGPTRSLRGLMAKYGPAPSAAEIDQNRAEMCPTRAGSSGLGSRSEHTLVV